MNGITRAMVLAIALASAGCGFSYHFKDAQYRKGEEHDKWASYFFWGIVGNYQLDIREVCPQGVFQIITGDNVPTWFLRVVTIGIYSPRKVNVWCSAGPAAARSDERHLARIGLQVAQ